MKNYKLWIKVAATFQLLTATMHACTLFINQPPANDTEKILFQLMSTYQFDLGAGFRRTMEQLTLALSASLSLLCLLAGLIHLFLLKKNIDRQILKGIVAINLIVFGILFILTIGFAFLIPIIQIGLILFFLIMSGFAIRKSN